MEVQQSFVIREASTFQCGIIYSCTVGLSLTIIEESNKFPQSTRKGVVYRKFGRGHIVVERLEFLVVHIELSRCIINMKSDEGGRNKIDAASNSKFSSV